MSTSNTLPDNAPRGPLPMRPPQAGVQGSTRFMAFWGLAFVLGVLVRLTAVSPLTLAVVACAVWFVLKLVISGFADVVPPAEPRRQTAPLPHVRSEPPRTVPDFADACEICGRTLTNLDSRRARVGTDCIRTHGPRPRHKANPDHDRWNREMARARVAQAGRQVMFNREHDKAMEAHQADLNEWAANVATPEGAARIRRYRRASTTRSLAGIAVWVALVGHFVVLFSTPPPDYRDHPQAHAIKAAVLDFTAAYYDGDYATAHDLRWSERCKVDDYASRLLESQLKANETAYAGGGAFDVVIEKIDDDRARVTYQHKSRSAYTDYTAERTNSEERWVLEGGLWKFDDC